MEALLASSLPVRGALVTAAFEATARGRAARTALDARAVPVATVSEAEFATAADTETPQGVLAVAAQPASDAPRVLAHARDGAPVVALDSLQDPGNAGTILRAAAAFGAAGLVAMPGTVDLWSAKVVRSGMGAHFQVPLAQASWAEVDVWLAEPGTALWGAAGDGDAIAVVAPRRPGRLLLAIGNEGAGLGDEARRRAERLVAVPIAPIVESLNAAVAAAVLLYELRPPALRSATPPS